MPATRKPLLKWLIGPVSSAGWESLAIACDNARGLYGDEVDFAVCFNQVSRHEVARRLGATRVAGLELVDQTPHRPAATSGFGWKFFPLKLDDARRELWMDNDVILYARQPDIETFLFGEREELLVAQDARRWYGPARLDQFLPAGQGCCGGVLGIPAWPVDRMRANFEAFVDRHAIPREMTHFTSASLAGSGCENATVGLLALLYASQCRWIPHADIPVGSAIREGAVGRCGMHFTGLNHEGAEIEPAFRRLANSSTWPRGVTVSTV